MSGITKAMSSFGPVSVMRGMLSGVLLALMAAAPVLADDRAERPIQMQVDGLGVTLGWHISELVYVGVTHHASTDIYNVRGGYFDEDDEIYNQRGVLDAEMRTGHSNSFEVRLSPWEHGFYFAFGVLRVEGNTQDILYDERARVVGDGAYVTGIRLRVQGKAKTAGALGIGFNHVFDYGLSLGAGFLIGLDQPDPPEIDVQVTNPAVLQSDIDKFRAEVDDDFDDTPVMFHLAIGYNF